MSEETWALEQRIAELEAQLALLANNNPDLFSGPGRMHFGGKVMRLDKHGMQVDAGNANEVTVIYFTDGLLPDPSDPPSNASLARIYAHAGTGNVRNAVLSQEILTDPTVGTHDWHVQVQHLASKGTGVDAGWIMWKAGQDSDTSVYGYAELYVSEAGRYFKLTNLTLRLASFGVSDPGTLQDGDLWYRSDTDKFRARVNGATESLVTEESLKARQDYIGVTDGVSAPATVAGRALIYVDTADGDLKVRFGDGTIKTLATDT